MNYYVHSLDPIAFQLGAIAVPWYWLVYVVGFFWIYWNSQKLCPTSADELSEDDLIDYMLWGWVAMLLGGRGFYILFYNLDYYLANPDQTLKLWKGGMSFHGGLIGIASSTFFVSRKKGHHFLSFCDLVATSIPFVLGFGRIANFINGELAGRVSTVPWAVIFPKLYDYQPRHPSQIYQAVCEGLILGLLLMKQRQKISVTGYQSASFLIGYGSFRFLVEFFRLPDPQLGYYFRYFTLGQGLCLIMISLGVILLYPLNKTST